MLHFPSIFIDVSVVFLQFDKTALEIASDHSNTELMQILVGAQVSVGHIILNCKYEPQTCEREVEQGCNTLGYKSEVSNVANSHENYVPISQNKFNLLNQSEI